MPDGSQTNLDSLLGRLLIEHGLATDEDVQECLTAIRDSGPENKPSGKSLSAVLIDRGIITTRQLERIRPRLADHQETQKVEIPGYKLGPKLGAGAMAVVYKARQLSLDRPVAIKILPRKFGDDPNFVARFRAEGQAAAKLNHPNIVAALDVGKAGEYHYFVMEYVEGRTVFDDLRDKGRYREPEAIKIITQVVQALEHAHHHAGIIHRDVKPKNIMLTSQGVVKLADMGLARAVSDRVAAEAEQGKAYGTPYYISPEQARGEVDIDFRADIYSLGATLYHMVTGQVPFEGPNPSAVMSAHLKSPLIPPDHINPQVSTGLSEVVEVCMAKSRAKRYSSTSDLLEDLHAVERGEPPLQARKLFDMADLTALEAGSPNAQLAEAPAADQGQLNVWLFWAVVGWLAFAVCFVVLIVVLVSAGQT